MVIQSGVPPYEYSTVMPFRSPGLHSGYGLSGILLEEGQFVLAAEFRKFTGSSHAFPNDFHTYRPTSVDPYTEKVGPHEPKADGSNLANINDPIQGTFIDYIPEMRTALENLIDEYINDLSVSSDKFLEEWLHNAYHDHPGTILGFPPQRYVRSVPPIGDITTSDVSVLGGSGVWLDIDWGEVMFNPYPWVAERRFQDSHGDREGGGLSDFLIQSAPFWPAFQKTDGSLVSLNGNEPRAIDIENSLYQTDHIGSGKVRLSGYVLRDLTDYRLATGNLSGLAFAGTNDFNYFEGSARKIGSSAYNIETSQVFLTPTATTSGVYKILVRN